MMPSTAFGRVYLVGAGPGAADLITLRAARVLAHADVVLIDELVNRELLDHCRDGVKVIPVGKRAGCRSTPQSFIQHLMLRYARQGFEVVRLKGGDPYVFGRGGEEVGFLARGGVSAEVVSGITAGIAAPASIGIPVTHRGVTAGVVLVTGHTETSVEPDWRALVATGMTIVVYMGLRRIERIASALLENGMAASTPAAVIEQATRAAQRQVVAPLDAIAPAARAAGLRAPALIVIGDVVRFARAAHGAAATSHRVAAAAMR